jgi:hypothetical protein
MPRRPIPLVTVLVLVLAGLGAGCAGTRPHVRVSPSRTVAGAFEERAAELAKAWRAAGAARAWKSGFVPLEELAAPVGGQFPDGTRDAYERGWYRLATTLPTSSARSGDIRFPGGASLSVPLLTATEAYQILDRGDPTCAGCAALTVTGAKLGTVTLMTSRGRAEVPAWLFTIGELGTAISRVAVVPSAVEPVPDVAGPPVLIPGVVRTEHVATVEGAVVTFVVGVGACDTDIAPLAYETEDAVVLGGSVHPSDRPCVLNAKGAPVRVTLRAPVGNRTLLDGLTGRPLVLQPAS